MTLHDLGDASVELVCALLALVLVFMAVKLTQSVLYHRRVGQQQVLFDAPVQVRLRRWRRWGKLLPDSHPSHFKLIVREGSVETNRQSILLPAWSDFTLTKGPRRWWNRTMTWSLDVGRHRDEAVSALDRAGVARCSGE